VRAEKPRAVCVLAAVRYRDPDTPERPLAWNKRTAGGNRDERIERSSRRKCTLRRDIRAHPLVPGDIPVYGYIYDVKTGRLIEVPEATRAGKARA